MYPVRPLRRLVARRGVCAAGALALLAGCAATSDPGARDARAELGAGGTLRAAINDGNPILARRGANGEPRGVSVDLARVAAQAWLSRFIQEMKASGFIADALQRHGIQAAIVPPRA